MSGQQHGSGRGRSGEDHGGGAKPARTFSAKTKSAFSKMPLAARGGDLATSSARESLSRRRPRLPPCPPGWRRRLMRLRPRKARGRRERGARNFVVPGSTGKAGTRRMKREAKARQRSLHGRNCGHAARDREREGRGRRFVLTQRVKVLPPSESWLPCGRSRGESNRMAGGRGEERPCGRRRAMLGSGGQEDGAEGGK